MIHSRCNVPEELFITFEMNWEHKISPITGWYCTRRLHTRKTYSRHSRLMKTFKVYRFRKYLLYLTCTWYSVTSQSATWTLMLPNSGDGWKSERCTFHPPFSFCFLLCEFSRTLFIPYWRIELYTQPVPTVCMIFWNLTAAISNGAVYEACRFHMYCKAKRLWTSDHHTYMSL